MKRTDQAESKTAEDEQYTRKSGQYGPHLNQPCRKVTQLCKQHACRKHETTQEIISAISMNPGSRLQQTAEYM